MTFAAINRWHDCQPKYTNKFILLVQVCNTKPLIYRKEK